MDLRQIVFHDYPNVVFPTLAAVTSAFGLSPTSTIFPIILTLSVLLVYSPILFREQPRRPYNVAYLVVALSFGSSAFRLKPSLEALSTPGGSLAALLFSSAILSSISIGALYVSTKLSTRFETSSAQMAIFPAIWATLWCTVAHLSPVGHLSTWSVANNFDAYNWMTPFVGSSGKDWIVAAWAVVISQTVGRWFIGFNDDEDIIGPLTSTPISQGKKGTILALGLTLLTIPSFLLQDLPLPVSTLEAVTPVSVGCVLPPYKRVKHHVLTVQDYIEETNKISNRVNFALWPEGAVIFDSVDERDKSFAEIRQRVTGPYIGVSFEETFGDPGDPTGRKHLSRTGLAVIGNQSSEAYLTYYKRHLVPVAESYRLQHSSQPPGLFEVQLRKPKDVAKTTWGSAPNYTRPLTITSSICLDFATPSPFEGLESRPGLILAPARTWDRAVGYAMWLQAKQRAEELGSTVLWCDGGEGGVSGVAGGGFGEVAQVGSGSFVQTIGVQYPFSSRPTLYARIGDSVLILWWIFVGGQSFILLLPLDPLKNMALRVRAVQGRIVQYIHQRRKGHILIEHVEEQDLLG